MSTQNNNKPYQPYIRPEETQPELTPVSIILGVGIAILFGAANAYLALRVGMTVSASIPAAVISMVVMRIFLRRSSLLESNMVQTIGSAGESLAGGVVFTMPVFFLWETEGIANKPSLITLTILAVCGGVIGVLLMIPLRHSLVVKEHGVLPYPEGTACARVLLSAEKNGSGSKGIFAGMGIAALSKFLTDGVKVIPNTICAKIESLSTDFSAEVYPALISVGYICGPKISSYMFSGGILGWFVLIPTLVLFGGDTILFPASKSIVELYATGGAGAIWSNYLRYIGAGMVAAGGVFSLIKSLPSIGSSFLAAFKGMQSGSSASAVRTEQDLNLKYAFGISAALIVALVVLPGVPVALPGALLILLNSAWGFGSKEMSAPQASLMKMLIEGVMSGNLPWGLIFIGVFIAVTVELLGIPVLPVAIGLYLPLELSSTIMLGGIVRAAADRYSKKKGRQEGSGILFCSGLVAGEGLVGILLAFIAVTGFSSKLDLSSHLYTGPVGGVVLILLLVAAMLWFSKGGGEKNGNSV